MKWINVADIPDTNGMTVRQLNSKIKHIYSVGDFVELKNGARVFVTMLTRDCDETPLYNLGPELGWSIMNGYSEESIVKRIEL